MRRLLLAACLALWSTAGEATQWWWLGNYGGAPARYNRYLDRDSIQKRSGGLVEAWTFDVTEQPNKDTGTSWSRTLQRFDCRNRTATPLATSAYSATGVLIGTATFDRPQTSPVAPGTAGGTALGFACKQGNVSADVVPDPVAHAVAYFKLLTTGSAAPPAAEAAPGQASQTSAAPEAGSLGNGTGFFVNPAGELVTCYHVVEGASAILVIAADGSKHRAEVLRASPATDLAVLAVDYRPARYLTLAPPGRAKPGDHVFTFGYPVMDMLGSEAKYTDGAISSLSGYGDEASVAQISIPVQPGNSGGPVVNERGEVVGVVDAGAEAKPFMQASGALPQNVNWAVRGDYVVPLIRAATPLPVRSRDEAVALARDSVALVWVKY